MQTDDQDTAQTDDQEQWLQTLPLDEPVLIEGESLYLRVEAAGAELGATFLEETTDEQLHDALFRGFQNAIEYEAGWALAIDGETLLLTRWIPGASSWMDVEEEMGALLEQIADLRGKDFITKKQTKEISNRDESRIRSKLLGG